MKKNIFIHLGVGLFFALGILLISGTIDPSTAYAQSGGGGGYCPDNWSSGRLTSLGALTKYVTCFLLQLVVPLIFAVAIVFFLVGMLRFLRSDQMEKRKEGRQYMLWAIIALSVMLGIWGIVRIIGGTFGIQNTIPQLPNT